MLVRVITAAAAISVQVQNLALQQWLWYSELYTPLTDPAMPTVK